MSRIPAETNIPIRLAFSYMEATWATTEPSLVIVPDRTSWNDFHNNYRADLHIVGFGETAVVLQMRLRFSDESRTAEKVEALLAARRDIALESVDTSFVSILADTNSYKVFVKRVGFEIAIASLRRMRDLVLIGLEGEDPGGVALAQGVDFTRSMLRDDATWTALRQGGRYLTPDPPPDIEEAAISFTVESNVDGQSGSALNADFGSEFPLSRRMLVLVGENGVGKTRLFNALIHGLRTSHPWEQSDARGKASFAPRPTFARLLVFSSAASDPYPTQIPPWEGVDYRFHSMLGRQSGAEDDLAQSLLDVARSETEVDALGHRDSTELLKTMLEPLGIIENLHVEVDQVDTAILPAPLVVDGRSYLPFFSIGGEQRRLTLQAAMVPKAPPRVVLGHESIRSLSSGEQALLRFATHAIGSLRRGSMFLFDEPETHLHPRYVSLFMSMLDLLLEFSGSIALIATHSAYVVREVPSRRVRIMRKEGDGTTSIEPPHMQTFGASIDLISQFVFGDLSMTHRFQSALDRWLSERPSASVDEFRASFREDLNAEMLSYIAHRLEERHAK